MATARARAFEELTDPVEAAAAVIRRVARACPDWHADQDTVLGDLGDSTIEELCSGVMGGCRCLSQSGSRNLSHSGSTECAFKEPRRDWDDECTELPYEEVESEIVAMLRRGELLPLLGHDPDHCIDCATHHDYSTYEPS